MQDNTDTTVDLLTLNQPSLSVTPLDVPQYSKAVDLEAVAIVLIVKPTLKMSSSFPPSKPKLT
jgi:hypothetical protein